MTSLRALAMAASTRARTAAARAPSTGSRRRLCSGPGQGAHGEPPKPKVEKSDAKSGASAEANPKAEKSDAKSGASAEENPKLARLEKDIGYLKCVMDYQSKSNWTAISVFAAVLLSLPFGIHQFYMESKTERAVANLKHQMLLDKQKALEKKHKALKARLQHVEAKLSIVPPEVLEENVEDKEVNVDEKSNNKSWTDWFLFWKDSEAK